MTHRIAYPGKTKPKKQLQIAHQTLCEIVYSDITHKKTLREYGCKVPLRTHTPHNILYIYVRRKLAGEQCHTFGFPSQIAGFHFMPLWNICQSFFSKISSLK